MSWTYGTRITPEDGEFVVTVRDLPEVSTAGATREEAIALAADAIDAVVYHRIRKGLALPSPSPVAEDEVAVPLPLQSAVKAALHQAFLASGITKVELARRIGVKEGEARRILDPRHNSRIPVIEEAAKALGARIDVRLG